MKPSEVPDPLIRIATEGLMGLEVRRVIANVWPEIERQVRERVAAEILETIDADVPGRYEAGLEHAARIARGES